jgi:hypothetical protein
MHEDMDLPTAWVLPGYVSPQDRDEFTPEEQAVIIKYSGEKLYEFLVRLNQAPAPPELSNS